MQLRHTGCDRRQIRMMCHQARCWSAGVHIRRPTSAADKRGRLDEAAAAVGMQHDVSPILAGLKSALECIPIGCCVYSSAQCAKRSLSARSHTCRVLTAQTRSPIRLSRLLWPLAFVQKAKCNDCDAASECSADCSSVAWSLIDCSAVPCRH